jgi:hypothetical protein
MTDTASAPLASIAPASVAAFAALTPENQAPARAALAQAGYDVAALGQVAPPAAPAPAAGAVSPPDAARVAAWRNMEKHWTGDKAQLVAAGLAAGVDLTVPEAIVTAQVADVVAAKADAATKAALAPPAKARGYKIEWPNARDLDATALKAQDSFMREGMFATGVPANLAQPLAQALIDTAKQYISKLDPKYATDDDIEREQLAFKIKALEEGARVRALNMPDIARLAEVAMAAMPKAFRAQLESLHSMTSANAFAALAGIGRAIEARKGK